MRGNKKLPAFVMTVIHLVLISSESVCNKIVWGEDEVPDLATGMTVTSRTKERLASFWGLTEDMRRFHRFLFIWVGEGWRGMERDGGMMRRDREGWGWMMRRDGEGWREMGRDDEEG
jgi:hypothetical protein